MAASTIPIEDSREGPSQLVVSAPAAANLLQSKTSALIAQVLILAFLFAVPAIRAFYKPCVVDPDIWWHISIGDWIAQHHAVPHVDFMSRSVAGQPWQAYSWLFDLLTATLFRVFGLSGVVFYTAGMLFAISIGMYRLAARRLDFSLAVGLTFIVGFSIMPLETPRSWLFTILFFLLELDILLRVRQSGKSSVLIWIPVILALWANLHIQFVHGLIMLSIAFIEAAVGHWRRADHVKSSPLSLGATLVASLAATLCNPYSWHIYRIAYDFGSKTQALNKISEVQAMPFRDLSNFTVLLLAFGATAVLARQSRLHNFETMLLAFSAFVSFHSFRDIWVVAVVACAILGAFGFIRNAPDFVLVHRTSLVTATLLGIIICAVSAHTFKLNNGELSQVQRKSLPVDAADFVAAHHLQGPLYNDFNWGGYLYWRLREPVSMDGRVAPYGTDRTERSIATWAGSPDWASDPQLETANVVVAPLSFPLAQLLRQDARFHLVYEDRLAAVFTR